jgi:hypothetical protein
MFGMMALMAVLVYGNQLDTVMDVSMLLPFAFSLTSHHINQLHHIPFASRRTSPKTALSACHGLTRRLFILVTGRRLLLQVPLGQRVSVPCLLLPLP